MTCQNTWIQEQPDKKENRQTREIALSCVDGFSGLWGLFFWQSQNFIFDQLIGLVKGFDHLVGFRMEIDFIQRFGFGRVPDSTFQDILVDTCAITEAGVCMPGGVGRISGELPGKLRFTLAVLVIRIRLNANFLQERIELAVAPVLFVPKTSFAIWKKRAVFPRGGIRIGIRSSHGLRRIPDILEMLPLPDDAFSRGDSRLAGTVGGAPTPGDGAVPTG